jgi:hypothetical protein
MFEHLSHEVKLDNALRIIFDGTDSTTASTHCTYTYTDKRHALLEFQKSCACKLKVDVARLLTTLEIDATPVIMREICMRSYRGARRDCARVEFMCSHAFLYVHATKTSRCDLRLWGSGNNI